MRNKILLQKALLVCGIIAPLLNFASDLVLGILYPGYSFIDQAISELLAIGAPTMGFAILLFSVYDLLMISFASGIWLSANGDRALRRVAVMVVLGAANGLLLWHVFPMHMRGAEMGFTDVMHVALAGVGVIFILLALVFGSSAFGRQFRLYSMITILMLLLPGIVVFLYYIPQFSFNLPTQWVGLVERISTYVALLWLAVLAVVLLRKKQNPASIDVND